MASRFERYRVARGDNIGDPDYWNGRFRDVDTRLVAVEEQKDTLDEVIEEGRTVFRTRVDEILVPLVQGVNEIAELGALLRAHSSSEVEVSTGGKTFFVDEADRLRFAAPAYLTFMAAGNPGVAMSGALVSYSSATGELVVNVDQISGSGWIADWTVSVGNTTDAVADAVAARAARDDAVQARNDAVAAAGTIAGVALTVELQRDQVVTANGQAQTAKNLAEQAATTAAAEADDAAAVRVDVLAAKADVDATAAAAAASAGVATSKATIATDKAAEAVTAAGTATTAAGTATTKAGEAVTSAGTATAKAAEATTARDAAVTAKNDTVAAIAGWSAAVLPPSATDPATRQGGAALQVGDQFFKTSDNKWRTWDGGAWVVNAVPLGSEVASVFGRGGSVSAQAGDYRGDQVSRTSAQQAIVAGADVEAAIQTVNTALGGKAASVHSHAIGDVTGLQTALDGKAAAAHSHTIANVTGLQSALDAKLDDSQATATGLAVLGAADAAAVRTAAGLGSFATRSSILGSEVGRSASDQTVVAGATVEAATQALKSAIDAEVTSRSAITVTGGGLVTGGGALSANRTLTVTKSTQAQAQAGTDDTTAMTPLRVADAVAALVPAASTTVVGKARLSTTTEATTGTAVDIAVTPAGLKAATDAVYTRIVGAAPEVLNQIAEISASLNNDANFAVTVSGQIAVKLDTSATSAWARGGFINAADAAAARTYLGLGSGATTTLSTVGAAVATASDAAAARTAIGAQASLGFTPIQQGGGTGQGANKVYIGWGAGVLRLQIDTTDHGSTWPISITGTAASATNATTATTATAVPTWANDAARPAGVNGKVGYNTARNRLEGYVNGAWVGFGANDVFRVNQSFTATAGQASFTVSGGFDPTTIMVFRNGYLVENADDVTVSSGTAIVFTTPCVAGETVRVVAFNTFTVAGLGSAASMTAALTGADTVVKRNSAGTLVDSQWDVEIEDQKPSGTGAGAASVGTWFTRVFNTVVRNTVGATLSGNQITLPAGTWEIWWEVPGYRTLGHVSRLYNVSDAAVVKVGGTEVLNNATVQSRSSGTAEVTISVAKTYRVEHWFYNNNGDANGCGVDISSGSVNVFARLRAKRVG